MARRMHLYLAKLQRREGEMSEGIGVRTAACSDYERLLSESTDALYTWKNRREQIARLGLEGKRTGDELQRLQAEYARAYNRLERHAKSCATCQFATEFEDDDERGDTVLATRKQASA
jgi:hypothetical protein